MAGLRASQSPQPHLEDSSVYHYHAVRVAVSETLRVGISSGHLSNIISGKVNPSPGVLKRLHAVFFQRTMAEERVMPAEVKVLGWSKGEGS